MSSENGRRSFSPEQKAAILRRHLVDKVAVSDLCDEYKIRPSVFYLWQRQAMEHLAAVFANDARRGGEKARDAALAKRNEELEAKLAKKDQVIAEISEEHMLPKTKTWGDLRGRCVPTDTRDEVVDFVKRWSERTELSTQRIVGWLDVPRGKFYEWRERYGKANEHNALVPRDHWLLSWEREAILAYHERHSLEGYRRLTFMMIDGDVVALSPTTVYRVLKSAGLLDRWNGKRSLKGTGFAQPTRPHEHWHIDVSYLNIAGTFYYLCAILDGYSRYVVHWEIRETMREPDVEVILQRALEKFPGVTPRLISDRGPQFIARDLREFIRISGMTHVRTSPYYPQSNGKIEAWNKTVKRTTIRPKAPGSLEEAIRLVAAFVEHYNNVRLHSAIGYVAPADMLAGRQKEIWQERDRKIEAAREARRQRRAAQAATGECAINQPPVSCSR